MKNTVMQYKAFSQVKTRTSTAKKIKLLNMQKLLLELKQQGEIEAQNKRLAKCHSQ